MAAPGGRQAVPPRRAGIAKGRTLHRAALPFLLTSKAQAAVVTTHRLT